MSADIATLGKLGVLQLDVYDRLLAAESLRTVSIFSTRPRVRESGGEMEFVTDTQIQQAVNSALSGLKKRNDKAGTAIEVMMPVFTGENASGGAALGDVEIVVMVSEKPIISMGATGTQITAERCAELVIATMQGWNVIDQSARQSSRGLILAGQAITPVGNTDGVVTYNVAFQRKEAIGLGPRCSAPQITVSGGFATITSATSGATIRYTLNGRYPGVNQDAGGETIPGVETYTVPVAIASGQTIRAVASKTGFADSDATQFTEA